MNKFQIEIQILWSLEKKYIKVAKCVVTYLLYCLILALYKLNKSRACDAIWPHGYLSTLVQVMACCLMAPSHYLNQWCVNAIVINWQGILSKRTFYGSFHFVVPQMMQTSRSWIIVCFGWFLTPWWPGVFIPLPLSSKCFTSSLSIMNARPCDFYQM